MSASVPFDRADRTRTATGPHRAKRATRGRAGPARPGRADLERGRLEKDRQEPDRGRSGGRYAPNAAGSGPEVAEGGREIGWEVLGYDYGLLHARLRNDLYQDGVLTLGVTTDERGPLPSRDAAERVAGSANTLGGTKPVTWFPAALIERDTPIESRFAPITNEAPHPSPQQTWWHRLVRLVQRPAPSVPRPNSGAPSQAVGRGGPH